MWPLLLLAVLAGPTRFDLQRALRDAHAGDTIRVPAGTYRGPVTIDKHVVVMGVPGTRIDGGRRGTTVTMSGDSAAFIGFTVFNSGRSLDDDDAAIKLVHCTACLVSGIKIYDSLHGVYLLESDVAVVVNNVIHGDVRLLEGRRGNGIHLFSSNGARVSGNTVRRSRDGIYFVGSNQTSVVGNDVAEVRYGVHYMYSDDNEFIRNRFTRNAAGAAIMVSKRIRFEDNVFSEHVGYRAYGILLQTAEQVIAERNRIEGNLTGLFMDASVGNTFRHNLISGNGVGIDMLASSEGNVFSENTIVSNRTAVRTVLGIGSNQWAQAGRGNYWGSKDVFDLNGNGIGDRPLRVTDPFATLAAMRPVLEIFNGTLAATALSWAERALPLFGLPEVVDPAPLAARPYMRARP
jgi:nitrous oxidase accessory protein